MMKKIYQLLLAILLTPIAVMILVGVLLYLPPVQRMAVDKATAILAESTGLRATVGQVRLYFLFDLDLQEVHLADHDGQVLLDVEQFIVDLRFTSLLRGRIDVDGITLRQAQVDSRQLIPGVTLRGDLQRFFVDAHGIDLPHRQVTVDRALLEDVDLQVALATDTTAADTSTTAIDWAIALQRVDLKRIRLHLSMMDDSLQVATGIRAATLLGGQIDLGAAAYRARHFCLRADSLRYDQAFVPPAAGLDPNHLALHDVALRLDSIAFCGAPLSLSARLERLTLRERCGLQLDTLQARVYLDSTLLRVPLLRMATPHSSLRVQAVADLRAVEPQPRGQLDATLTAHIGKGDVLLLVPGVSTSVARAYPTAALRLDVAVQGHLDSLRVPVARASMDRVFALDAHSNLQHLTDSLRMAADAHLTLNTYDLSCVTRMVGGMGGLKLPPMRLEGYLQKHGADCQADVRLREGKGLLQLLAHLNLGQMSYGASLRGRQLQLHHFLPTDSLFTLSFKAGAQGRGTDPFSPRTQLAAHLAVEECSYGSYDLGHTTLDAVLQRGVAHLTADCRNDLVDFGTRLDALVNRKKSDLTFSLDMRRADLYALRVTPKPLKVGMCLHVDGHTDLRSTHQLDGEINDITLVTADTIFRPKDILLNLLALPDTTFAQVRAGDFALHLDGSEGYESLLDKTTRFATATGQQLGRRWLDQDSLKTLLPRMSVQLSSGHNNPVSYYLTTLGYRFDDLDFRLSADPEVGLNGGFHLYALNAGGILLDTIRSHIFQDTTGMKMDAQVRNGPKNRQFVFDSRINAYVHSNGGGMNLRYTDEKGRTGVDLGLGAELTDSGVCASFTNIHPIVAYRRFDINKDNYIFLGNDRRVEADVDMMADDGTGLKIYSTPNDEALQDLTLSLLHLNLGELTAVIPYAPRITGYLGGDAHLIQTTDQLSVMADLSVDDMAFEGAPLGRVGLNAVYLPNADGTHFIDSRILQDDEEVMVLTGSYRQDDKTDHLEADLDLLHLPLSMANGFIADGIATLQGHADGSLKVEGPTDKLLIDGWLSTTGVRVLSPAYSLNLRLEDDSIKITRSHLNLDRLNVYSTGKNPLVFDGQVDFADFNNILLNLWVNTTNFELINAKRTQQASAYGKVYVDMIARMKGSLSDLDIKGRLGVLGSTDVTYVLKDTPLTAEDRLEGLVTFVDFSDTTGVAVQESTRPTNLNMAMQLIIDEGAQVHCLLSPDRSKYIDLEGGGELTMYYTPQGELTLNGRYTVLSGEMKYALPVIPLKTFSLTSGSYVDFNGPVLNPTLNIAATERVRATVTENDVPRTVAFDVGLSITQTLENMGLEFTLAAPEDMSVQNQLAAMSLEQRGRLAVTMLATGMYLADGNEGGFSTTNALNALLQSEISNIAGKALETIDLSLGVDKGTQADGTDRTDYSFRFAKRLWGNRVSIIIGGKVSTGENVENTGQSLIDNVSIEYRLDKSGTRYVTLFYDKNYESLLEGEIVEMGGGLVLRRKMTHLGELFIFRNKKKSLTVPENSKP